MEDYKWKMPTHLKVSGAAIYLFDLLAVALNLYLAFVVATQLWVSLFCVLMAIGVFGYAQTLPYQIYKHW